MSQGEEYDVVLVGAGFGAVAALARLRKLGFKCKILEKGSGSGGIWYWNCYPGARVDSDAPIYQLFDKEIWQGFTFQERYPGWQELRRYFAYLEEKLDLKKDMRFDCMVKGARFDEKEHKWTLDCSDGIPVKARWFIPCIGFAAKAYTPPYKGIEKFKGIIEHTATWPQSGVETKGKRIAVIGSGASGVQTFQETAHEAKQITMYQRTPNLACPMNQLRLDADSVEKMKAEGGFEKVFAMLTSTFAGFAYDFQDRNTFDDTPEQREAFYRDLLVTQGGFRFWLNTYKDMLFDDAANLEAYKFWRDFTRSRIDDPRKKEILAPMEPPHPWGTKRPSLEQYYYECYNLPHADLIDISADPIAEFTETGIKTESGDFHEFDVVALATGFDAVTGSLSQLDIRANDGHSIADHWKDGLKTSMGMAMSGFPNMFFLYGPQAPTAFSNGPTCVQVQAKWLEDFFTAIKGTGITRVEATDESEEDWKRRTHEAWDATLFPKAKSWYQGANIPGRKVEPLNWAGGIPTYIEALDKSLENNFQGWKTAEVSAAA